MHVVASWFSHQFACMITYTHYDHITYIAIYASNNTCGLRLAIPYMAKLSNGKTFAVVHKIHYSLENFCGASGRGHHILYAANDSRGKLLRSAEKPQKFCLIR